MPAFDVIGLSRQQLLHYALLQAVLMDGGGAKEVLRVGFVTEVYQADSKVMRRFRENC